MGKLQIREEIVDLVMNLEDYMKGAPDMKLTGGGVGERYGAPFADIELLYKNSTYIIHITSMSRFDD